MSLARDCSVDPTALLFDKELFNLFTNRVLSIHEVGFVSLSFSQQISSLSTYMATFVSVVVGLRKLPISTAPL